MNLKSTETLQVALDFGDHEIKVGRMAYRETKIWFEYDPSFRESGLEISPIHLPVTHEVVTTKYQPFEGLYGVFNDSLPDGWGRLVLDRALVGRGIAPQRLNPLDRLAYVGRNGMGALVYYPEIETDLPPDDALDLNRLADEIQVVVEGEASDILDELYWMGGSSAGARPKVVACYNPAEDKIIHGRAALAKDYEHWLIKFPSSSDFRDIAPIEFAYSEMARAAGVEMEATKLFVGTKGRTYFGTRRFDRQGPRRLHMHTASGLLHADQRVPILDYETLMNATLWLNNDVREAEKVYRLAAFNVFAHNRDDHSKNFSFLMDAQGEWRFAPAYDLTFSSGPAGEHWTMILGEGASPNKAKLLQLGEKFGVKNRNQILDQVREAVNQWKDFAAAAGVSKASTEVIGKVLNGRG